MNSEASFHTTREDTIEEVFDNIDYFEHLLEEDWEARRAKTWEEENSYWLNKDFWESHKARS